MRAQRQILSVSAAAALATVAIGLAPGLQFAYRSPSLHLAIETAGGIVATIVAYVIMGRFRQTRHISDLLLAAGLATMGAANLIFSALPMAFAGAPLAAFPTWTALAGRSLAAAILVAAAFAPARRLRSARVERLAILLSANALALVALGILFVEDHLPSVIDPMLSPASSAVPVLVAHPLVHAVQVLRVVFLVAAAIGFARRADRTNDELERWLAVACVLGAFASIHYALFPSLYSAWVYTGDFFRLGFYVTLLVATAREIWSLQRRAAQLAVVEERRRIARDLHDGLAQELNYIAGAADTAAARAPANMRLRQIAAAAERALDESRRAIAALTRPADEPLDTALAQAAYEVANRVGAKLALELDTTVEVPAPTREQLVRIVREAVTNAARHGRASNVRVTLLNGNGITLTVSDDGEGFDPEAVGDTGFGLLSMRERARAVGGELSITSRRAAGTKVELVLPAPAAP